MKLKVLGPDDVKDYETYIASSTDCDFVLNLDFDNNEAHFMKQPVELSMFEYTKSFNIMGVIVKRNSEEETK